MCRRYLIQVDGTFSAKRASASGDPPHIINRHQGERRHIAGDARSLILIVARHTWLDLGNDDHAPAEQVHRLGVFAAGYGHSECTVSRIATHALTRRAMLAASTRARGKIEIAEWAASCADWTALNIVERLMPTGYTRSLV